MAREYTTRYTPQPNGKCLKRYGYFDESGSFTTITNYGEVDCPPGLGTAPKTAPTISIRKMEIAGKEVDTNTILKWAAIIAAVSLVGWYIYKKMR